MSIFYKKHRVEKLQNGKAFPTREEMSAMSGLNPEYGPEAGVRQDNRDQYKREADTAFSNKVRGTNEPVGAKLLKMLEDPYSLGNFSDAERAEYNSVKMSDLPVQEKMGRLLKIGGKKLPAAILNTAMAVGFTPAGAFAKPGAHTALAVGNELLNPFAGMGGGKSIANKVFKSSEAEVLASNLARNKKLNTAETLIDLSEDAPGSRGQMSRGEMMEMEQEYLRKMKSDAAMSDSGGHMPMEVWAQKSDDAMDVAHYDALYAEEARQSDIMRSETEAAIRDYSGASEARGIEREMRAAEDAARSKGGRGGSGADISKYAGDDDYLNAMKRLDEESAHRDATKLADKISMEKRLKQYNIDLRAGKYDPKWERDMKAANMLPVDRIASRPLKPLIEQKPLTRIPIKSSRELEEIRRAAQKPLDDLSDYGKNWKEVEEIKFRKKGLRRL